MSFYLLILKKKLEEEDCNMKDTKATTLLIKKLKKENASLSERIKELEEEIRAKDKKIKSLQDDIDYLY